jgi:uncharacterized protein YdhG (YjbR/CyaY superfamily)
MTTPATIDDYLAGVPEDKRAALQQVRETVQELVPEAEEMISYKMPGFRYRGRGFLYFAAWARHCALYGVSDSTMEAYRDELAPFRKDDSTLRFTPKDPIPRELLERLVRARLQEEQRAVGAR